MNNITVNSQRCQRCMQCVQICPLMIFSNVTAGSVPEVIHPERCISCGQCVSVCPAEAIIHETFISRGSDSASPWGLPALNTDLLPSWEQINELFLERRSVRVFQPRAVEREQIQRVLDAAQLAPSATNSRDTYWTVISDPERLHKTVELINEVFSNGVKRLSSWWIKVLTDLFPQGKLAQLRKGVPMMKAFLEAGKQRDMILHDAPVLLIAHYEKSAGRFADANAQLQIQNATLAAVVLGLGTFYTGLVTRAADLDARVGCMLGIPQEHVISGGMVLGYPGVTYKKNILRENKAITWIP